ncbi:Phthiocerol synthesis polyketide synthase type I PpsC [Folsomia candida]|uniref:Phthiocerol synthesis polyketide synthase type I PpsC n=1 Tax=Folsomia candida TaxID=158441 RepID=A0A226DU61_FOLCA|nr:Phthiocerol synthesis polyketide synthase type I PpsC [Folsomia candida]
MSALCEAWITHAEDDTAALKCLVLARSLRLSGTRKKMFVLVFPQVSGTMRKELLSEWDGTIRIKRVDEYSTELCAQIHALSLVTLGKIGYLNPETMILKNMDDLFQTEFQTVRLARDGKLTIAMLHPSENNFDSLAAFVTIGKGGLGTWLLENETALLSEKLFLDVLPTHDGGDIGDARLAYFMGYDPLKMHVGVNFMHKLWTKLYFQTGKNEVHLEIKPSTGNNEPIAIIGMAGRFPKCENLQEYWEFLIGHGQAASPVPEDRWTHQPVTKAQRETGAGFLPQPVDEFDAAFFGLSSRDLFYMDPQQRILLEVVWEALEDAALPPTLLKTVRTSIFTGSWSQDYFGLLAAGGISPREHIRSYLGTSLGATAGKLGHYFGLKGKNCSNDSACASSSVTVGHAVENLRKNDSKIAIACGINLLVQPFTYADLMPLLSPDGRCKSFDVSADGYGRAEGCGVLILKRLSDAIADNDRIHALIRGYGEEQEAGPQNIGTPSVAGETAAMLHAIRDAGIDPWQVSHIEAHGTGTATGDPIEFAAIANVYKTTGRKDPLIVTSGKGNIGHAEACSGMAGIIKTVLCLKNGVIPGHVGCKELNPDIKLDKIPAIIPLENYTWTAKQSGQPRMAGVSSFGFTGTDTHIILEEAPERSSILEGIASTRKNLPKNIVTLSAKSEEGLEGLISNLKDSLSVGGSPDLADIAFTRNTGRDHLFPWRAAITATNTEDLRSKLAQGAITVGQFDTSNPKLAFLFSGQGAQYYKMGFQLYSTFPVFQKYFDYCTQTMKSYGIDVLPVMWGENPEDVRIDEALYSQTGIFAVEFALNKLLASWGIKPDMVVGNSLGEFAAASAAGIWSDDDAIKIVSIRANLLEKVELGGMIVVKKDCVGTEALIQQFVAVHSKSVWVDVACINAAEQTVVSGDKKNLDFFLQLLENNGVKGTKLGTNKAYHSRHMDPMIAEYTAALETLTFHPARCHYVGGQSGKLVETAEMGPDYWVKQLRESVHFMDASKTLVEMGVQICLDVSPRPIAGSLFNSTSAEVSRSKIPCIPALRNKSQDIDMILTALTELYINGVNLDWRRFHQGFTGHIVSLPSYPFNRKAFWFTASSKGQSDSKELHPLLGSPLRNASSNHIFQSRIELAAESTDRCAWLKDHMLGKYVIYPGAGYIEMCLAGGYASTLASFDDFGIPEFPMKVQNLKIIAPMDINNAGATVQTIVGAMPSGVDEGGSGMDITVYKHRGGQEDADVGKWITHASSRVSFLPTTSHQDLDVVKLMKDWNDDGVGSLDKFYEALDKVGLKFGLAFRSLKKKAVSPNGSETLMQVELPGDDSESKEAYFCHPILIDAMIQGIMFVEKIAGSEMKSLCVPALIEEFVWYGMSNNAPYYIHIQANEKRALLRDSVGRLLATMEGAHLVETNIDVITKSVESQKISMPSIISENIWKPMPIVAKPEDTLVPEKVGENPLWLLFGPPSKAMDCLHENLKVSGREAIAVEYNTTDLRPDHIEDFREMVKKSKSKGTLEGIIYLPGDSETRQAIIAQGFLNLLKVLATTRWSNTTNLPKIVLVTEGIIPVGTDSSSGHPARGTLWGILRTFQSEFTNFKTTCIDLESESLPESKAEQIGMELWTDDGEIHVAYRGGFRHTPRATPIKFQQLINPLSISRSDRNKLILPASKAISDLKFGILPPAKLNSTEVEVRVVAAGLNFKDVLSVLKPSAEFDQENCIGADFCGIISSVGEAVTKWKVGDDVLGCNFEQGALPSHISQDQHQLVKLPSWFTHAEGATLPVVFSTAYHCLVTVGRLKVGETILVHAASGGVGLVAIQIAKQFGASVIATAGNKRKRAYLRDTMGVRHVLDSRSLQFEKEVKQLTNGLGVHLVLNSLTSPGFKEASLACLQKSGRFVEMSKLNTWSIAEANALRADVEYTVVDMTVVGAKARTHLCDVLNSWLETKKIEPLPTTRFESVCIREALNHLQKAKHIGKVVCLWGQNLKESDRPGLFNDRSTYLLTGGLGGIGMELLKYMTDNGAKHLVLFGRSRPSEKNQRVIDSLNSSGNNVTLFHGDVGKMQDCEALMQEITTRSLPPLRGVMHAAGCLSDGIFLNQNWEKMETCFNSKVTGGWNLHVLTKSLNLEHFVTYSSIAAILGSMGQANHSAGNWFLDGLVTHRISLGLPATTINWGQWGSVGVAADMEIPGLKPFTPSEAFTALEHVLKANIPQALVAEGDVSHISSIYPWTRNYFTELKALKGSTASSLPSKTKVTITTEEFWSKYDSSDVGGKPDVVQNLLSQAYLHVLKLPSGDIIKPDQALRDVGVDSMMTFEIKNIIQDIFGEKVSFTVAEISDCGTIMAMTSRLVEIIGISGS